jgi:transposase
VRDQEKIGYPAYTGHVRERELLRGLLCVEEPWDVTDAKLDLERKRVDVRLEWKRPRTLSQVRSGTPPARSPGTGLVTLISAAIKLCLHAPVPRVDCREHGIATVAVPWATRRSEFTARIERLAIALLLEMSVPAVARRLGIRWDAVEGISMRAVLPGKRRRIPRIVRHCESTRNP